MTITTTQIQKEANKIIKDIFSWVLKCDNKEKWEKAFNYCNKEIIISENWDRWLKMFAWRKVYKILIKKYWIKFIPNKNLW